MKANAATTCSLIKKEIGEVDKTSKKAKDGRPQCKHLIVHFK